MHGGLGCRAHDFGKLPLEELAARIADAGFDCLQFAPGKAVAGFEPCPDGGITAAFAGRAATAFASRGLRISVLGCYINPIHPVPEERRRSLDRFKAYLRAAPDLGCGIVATETGSLNADCSFNPGNRDEAPFEELVASVSELAEEAERRGVTLCVEGVVRHVAHSPRRLADLVGRVGSPALAFLLDPVNYLDASNYENRQRIIEEAFALFGPRIRVLHAKDLLPGDGIVSRGAAGEAPDGIPGARIVPPGKGLLDYGRILALLEAANPAADILIEDLRPGDMAAARDHLARTLSVLHSSGEDPSMDTYAHGR
jgi:sugar phosphate isomerase/epimerase